MKQEQEKEHPAPSGREKSRVGEFVPGASIEEAVSRRPGETRLELPVGEPDLDALRSVTREWLVPLLVEKFLREQGVELRAQLNARPRKTPISDP